MSIALFLFLLTENIYRRAINNICFEKVLLTLDLTPRLYYLLSASIKALEGIYLCIELENWLHAMK